MPVAAHARLSARDDPHPPALIAAFGMAHEIEPGVIAIAEHAVMAVHLIKLTRDGRKLDVTPNKITIGSPGTRRLCSRR